jgi:hypothetical protein
MIRIGEASASMSEGVVRNGFETVRLSRRLEVVVPTLVHIVGDTTREMFYLSTERFAERSRRIRIMARCVGATCSQDSLVDDGDRLATEYFRPVVGMRLTDNELPSILGHSFGGILSMMGDVAGLWDEVHEDEEVGLVVPVGKDS